MTKSRDHIIILNEIKKKANSNKIKGNNSKIKINNIKLSKARK